jgi:hypothetical protein
LLKIGFTYAVKRLTATAAYSFPFSIPINCLLVFLAATSVVPDPAKGSILYLLPYINNTTKIDKAMTKKTTS